MPVSRRFLDFNKEILFGELGSIVGAQAFSHISSKVFISTNWISLAAVIGAMLGSSLWLVVRVYDTTRRKEFSVKKIAEDMAYFTPVAIFLSLLIYYPTLFLLSRDFLRQHFIVLSSVFIAQIIAFVILLITFNIYRYLLMKRFGKIL